ncbi:uncharacterized protein [Procambarus clarkii]|uniref:uncharacterized protein isoform X1 n=2 Tax=Procambarus clarkii TaxID=6728 RepID=UPI00374382A6
MLRWFSEASSGVAEGGPGGPPLASWSSTSTTGPQVIEDKVTMNTRVAWILLFTYIVQLVLGGFGLWVAVQFSQRDAQSPPIPPTTTTALPTTLPPSQRNGYQRWDYHHESIEQTKEYREYVMATKRYADCAQNPRMYIMVPCSVAVMIAAGLVVSGICSRKTFTTTTGLYSSLGLWIVILLIAVLYQSVDWKPDSDFYSTLKWVIGLQVGLLLLLVLQIALAIWELRRQNKTRWPCINITHLFTVEMILLVTRLTLGIFIITFFNYSRIISGFWEGDMWDSPRVRYPEYYALPCIIAALYGVIVSGEGIGSLLLGKVHNRLMTFTTFMSAICYAALAVLASPVFVRVVIGPYRMPQDEMILAIASSIMSFLHTIACLAFPIGVRTPPHFIRTIAEIMSKEFSMNEFNIKEVLSSSSAAMSSAALTLRSKFRRCNTLHCNIISSALSVLAIILLGIGSGGYGGTLWPGILMLCGDVALFLRSLPEALSELVYHHYNETNLLKIMHLSLENTILFIGSIGAFSNGWPATQVVCGVINIVIVIVQTGRVMQYYKYQNKGISTVGETGEEEDTKPLNEAELETAQELSDEKHNGQPEILA